MSFFPRLSLSGGRFLPIFLLALSIFLPVHLLWFSQVPVWYPLRCLLNGLPITLFLFIPALLCARISRMWLILMTALLLIPAVLAGMHLYYYQATISQQSLFAILETNLSESLEFALAMLEKYRVEGCYYGHLHGPTIRRRIEGQYGNTDFSLISADYLGFIPKKICEM